jgi:ABC-type sugar transport system ATPase subunit
VSTAGTVAVAPARAATVEAVAVEIDDAVKAYSGGDPALAGLSLACPAGQVTVVIGPSGCGKTTMLRCVAGLESLDSGEIRVQGRAVVGVDPTARSVAMVFQNYALYPAKSVAENIAFPLRMARTPRAERLRRVHEAAELLRIADLLDRRPAELSGGQRQRVGIARAVVRRPAVLLMDEPLSNLDAALRSEMRAELRSLQRHLGTSTLYVTHDQTEALTMADRLIVLRAGRIEQAGPPEQLFARPATEFVATFLGAMNLLPSDGGVVIGVRAEELAVGPPGAGQLGVEGRVVLVELTGTEKLVHLRPDGADMPEVRVRVPSATAIGERLHVHARAEHVHRFDREGQRLP